MAHKLVKIKQTNAGYKVDFINANGTTGPVDADIVISAMPFTLLREVILDVVLPSWKTNAINNLGYGTNSKLLLGFSSRVWRNYQHSGYVFTNGVLQTGWDNSWLQPGKAGGYTIYQGGNKGLALGSGTPESQVPQFIQQMQAMWPGCGAAYNGNVKRMHWPEYPFTKGSFSCYLKGQRYELAAELRKPVGNIFFAGEQTSPVVNAFMNGGAATGRLRDQAVMAWEKVNQH